MCGKPSLRDSMAPVRLVAAVLLIIFGFGSGILHAQPASAPAPQSQPAPDLASATPSSALAYVELTHLDDQFGILLALLQEAGVNDPLEFVQQVVRSHSPTTAPAFPGLSMLLNPAMMTELRKLDGLSIAVLDLPGGESAARPSFLVTLQFGRSEALKQYLMLMLAAASRSAEPHEGWSLHHLTDDLEVAILEKGAILGSPQGQAGAAAERWLQHKPSLADARAFRDEAAVLRHGGGLLAYLNWPQLAAARHRTTASGDPPGLPAADQFPSIPSLRLLWASARVGFDVLDMHAVLDFEKGRDSAYRLFRTRPLNREILQFVPADTLGCLAMSLGHGAGPLEAIVQLLAAPEHPASQPGEASHAIARDKLAQVEESLGFDLDEALQNVEAVAIAMLPPDVPALARPTTGPTSRPIRPVVPTKEQMLRSSLFLVMQVSDPVVFDRVLERSARLVEPAPGAQSPPVSVDRRTVAGSERRTYRVGDQAKFHAGRLGSTYVLAARPELVDAAFAAHVGRIPHLLAGRLSQPVLDTVPSNASKLLLVRVDLLVNTITTLGLLSRGVSPGRVLYTPVPNLKPAVAFTVERDERMEVSGSLNDLISLSRSFLRMVPRPPPARPSRVPATRPG